jgi:hypothetical protein
MNEIAMLDNLWVITAILWAHQQKQIVSSLLDILWPTLPSIHLAQWQDEDRRKDEGGRSEPSSMFVNLRPCSSKCMGAFLKFQMRIYLERGFTGDNPGSGA